MKNISFFFSFVFLFLLIGCESRKGVNVIIYPAPEGVSLNTKYQVMANGLDVPVYNAKIGPEDSKRRNLAMDDKAGSSNYYDIAGFASFDLKKESSVIIEIRIGEPIAVAKVLPSSLRIIPEIKGNSLSFRVDAPGHFTIDINEDYVRSLHIFVNEEETDIPNPEDPDVIWFGPGLWDLTTMTIPDNTTVYIAGGAVIKGFVKEDEAYEISSYSGLKTYNKGYMFELKGDNITFRGRGIIDMENVPTHGRQMMLVNGENINIEGVILCNSSSWTMPVRESKNVTVNNVKIFGHRANSDGIDICASEDVLVENCFMRTLDDLVVVKALKNSTQGVKRVLVRNCVLWNEVAHALSIGAEITMDVEDVLFTDCDIIHDHCREWSLRVYQTDGATVRNVRFENIRIEESVRFASLWIGKAYWSTDPERGNIRDIVFKNITVEGKSPLNAVFHGYDEKHTVEDVLLQDIWINGERMTEDDLEINDFVKNVVIRPALKSKQEKIIAAGSGNPQIVRIDKATGKVEWSHSLEKEEECNSIAVTDNGNLLYSYKKGAKLITQDHEVVWDYTSTGNEEVQSVSLLKNGNYLLGICGNPARLVEIDKSGHPVNHIELDLEIENPHSQFRQVRELRNGNYLLPVLSKQKLMEIGKDGKVLAEYAVSGSPFSVLEKKDGLLLLSLGDAHAYSIFDKLSAKEIGRVEENDIAGIRLLFVAQILELKNGNLLICNWHGHTKDASVDEPQFIEIDKKGSPVWSLNDKENIGKISAACLAVF